MRPFTALMILVSMVLMSVSLTRLSSAIVDVNRGSRLGNALDVSSWHVFKIGPAEYALESCSATKECFSNTDVCVLPIYSGGSVCVSNRTKRSLYGIAAGTGSYIPGTCAQLSDAASKVAKSYAAVLYSMVPYSLTLTMDDSNCTAYFDTNKQ